MTTTLFQTQPEVEALESGCDVAMPNDPVPTNPLAAIFENVNLPKIIAGPAGEAVSKLVGGVVDIPAAWLNQFAQGIRDKTEAKIVVSKAVAAEAAKLASSDPDIVHRAAQSFLIKELRHQAAKESIAKKTVEILQEEAKATPEGSTPPPEHPVDDDWMNIFTKYAEDASTERMQDLWARVLAGQIRKRSAFSLQTLRFIAELDRESASLFEKYSARVVLGDFIPFPAREGEELSELLTLEQFGLVTGPVSLHKTFDLAPGPAFFSYKLGAVLVVLDRQQKVLISTALLTRTGREVFQIIKLDNRLETEHHGRHFADQFPKEGVSNIFWCPPGLPLIPLWQAPAPPPTTPAAPQ